MRIAASFALFALITGCGALRSPEIIPVATVRAVPTGCELMVEGFFPDMAHDPITILLSGSSKIKAYFIVTSPIGTFEPSQINARYEDKNGDSWNVKSLSGAITLKQNSVNIDLTQTFPGRKPRAVDFNGNYNLTRTDNCQG